MTTTILGLVFFSTLIVLLSLLVLLLRSWLIPSTPVAITVNQQSPKTVNSGGKLLQVLTGLDVPVPSACAGAGTCGLCKVAVLDGGGPLLSTEASRLTTEDRKQKLRLACQVVVRNDMSVNVPSQILQAEAWQSTIQSVRSLSPLIREFVLTLPTNKPLSLKPGEYVQVSSMPFRLDYSELDIDESHLEAWNKLGVGMLKVSSKEVVTRAYSLANRPDDQESIVLLIRLALPPPAQQQNIAPGIVSSWLFSRKVGDVIDISGPYGDFGLRENNREMVLIGGGVGMAPLRSIIHHELGADHQRSVSFFYGARSEGDLFYQQEFDQLQRDHQRFNWTTALSDPEPDSPWEGPTGFIHDIFKTRFLDSHPHPERCDYYLCGPPLMQKAVMSVLDDAGVDTRTIFSDVFGE